MKEFKFIRDTIHGTVKVSGLSLELLDTPEFQRLRGIKQLGLANQVYPGANHTRFEHSFGTSVIAEKMARSLGLDERDSLSVIIASLLHDLGHTPFSHTLEMVIHEALGVDHMEITKRIITGEYNLFEDEENRIPGLIEKYGLTPAEVASLITGRHEPCLEMFIQPKRHTGGDRGYLSMVVHGTIDADQMDYLLRDAYHTGVAYGIIDLERILNTLVKYKNQIAIHRKGVTAIEGMLVARGLMYSAVYMHKTVRIAELMLARGVEHALSECKTEIHKFMDDQLISWLERIKGYPADIVRMLRRRELYKCVYTILRSELTPERKDALLPLCGPEKRKEIETEICHRMHAPEGTVIVDIPMKEILISEPRITKTDILVWDNGKVTPFSKVSTLSTALRNRYVVDWAVMVSAHPRYLNNASRHAKKVLP